MKSKMKSKVEESAWRFGGRFREEVSNDEELKI
jgi:hypothetical protein